ncbi:MAG: DNA primase [Humidesulfovibrio sp.]|uniref:DNA primase n=1 Tax=Humidesulfovibrio sp. TaxID=2910988 RepID=UPI0027F69A5B|nr:DNA primase [Humidesulfovibrio sp.]MDQ7834485.1 DNA primase [Humidesulfovibrio sp.]
MDNQVIQTLKQRVNIVDVVGRYVALRPASGRHMGLCPFHQEKTASFSVNEVEGFYYCFGCQAGGDVLDFYMRINGLEFKDALRQLAEEAGIELNEFRPDPEYDERQKLKRQCLEMHEQAQEYYRRNLNQVTGDAARSYLRKRGTSPEISAAFGLGASPDDWHGLLNHLVSRGFSPEQGVLAGLLSKNDKGNIYDRFRGRLIFPIQNLSGQVIAFGGRIITEGEPKYLNSSDTPIYKKGEHLYGLHQARQAMTRSKRAILTEGYMDVLSLAQFGYADSCGVLGTALTQEQVKRLSGFCSRIDLIFDGDGAGRKAALRSAEMILHQGVACRVLLMPDGEDVDSLLHKQGREGLDACFEKAADGLDYCLDTIRENFAPREIVAWATGFLGQLSDNALRAYYLPRLADGLGLSEMDLRRQGGSQSGGSYASGAGRQNVRHEAGNNVQPSGRTRRPVGSDDANDRKFIEFSIQYPDYIPHLAKRGLGNVLSTDWGRHMWQRLSLQRFEEVANGLGEEDARLWRDALEKHPQLTGDELADHWASLCTWIEKQHKDVRRRELMHRLAELSMAGDVSEVKKVQMAIQALNAPSREEE